MHWTRLAADCTNYATFHSHNQKVVQTPDGIFAAYLAEYDAEQDRCRWRLARSTDGGRSFSTCFEHEVPYAGKPPCLEAAPNGDILALCEQAPHATHRLALWRFRAGEDWRRADMVPIGPTHYCKFSMAWHRPSDRLFICNHYGRIFVVDPEAGFADGGGTDPVERWVDVARKNGATAQTQYPHIGFDGDVLHHAWTSQKLDRHLYWDIHYAQSRDLGHRWVKADGTPLRIPVEPDEASDADQLILPDEFEAHTWLTSMLAAEGKVHFAYYARPPADRQHYVRIDLATGRIDRRIQPEWWGDRVRISSLNGFFASRPGGPLVYVGYSPPDRVGAIMSFDRGDSWEDLALSEPVPHSPHAIGGSRTITPDGCVIGSFADVYVDDAGRNRSDPYFFRIDLP